jgi:hypothetical protein
MIGGGVGDAEPKKKGACSSHAPRSVQEAARAALEYSVSRSMMSMARDMSLRVIEWKARIGNRKIYFGGESGVVLGSQAANITAPGFDFSVYAYSPFFQEIANANLLEVDGLTDPDFAHILEYIRDEVGDYFRTRQAERSSELIQDLKPDLDSRTGFRHREWQKCWRLIKPGGKCGAKL